MWVSTSHGEYQYVGFFEVAGGGRVLAASIAGVAAVGDSQWLVSLLRSRCVLEHKIDSTAVFDIYAKRHNAMQNHRSVWPMAGLICLLTVTKAG